MARLVAGASPGTRRERLGPADLESRLPALGAQDAVPRPVPGGPAGPGDHRDRPDARGRAHEQSLGELAALGVRLVLDDFGTGYSSLSWLKQHPFGAIKIDHSFIHGLPDDPGDRAIVGGVLEMARALGCTVTAEGVETERQLAILRSSDVRARRAPSSRNRYRQKSSRRCCARASGRRAASPRPPESPPGSASAASSSKSSHGGLAQVVTWVPSARVATAGVGARRGRCG